MLRGVTELERRMIAGADVVALQRECPAGSAFEAAEAAQAAGRIVILNAAPAQGLPPELLALVDVLIVNEGEAATILRDLGLVDAGGNVDDQVRALAERVPAVVVTRGAAGLVLGRGDQVLAVSAHQVDVVDTTGAGDTFCGALAAEIARGSTLEEASRYASAAAALSVGRRGAVTSIPTRSQVEELLAQP
jgi:ribokinase